MARQTFQHVRTDRHGVSSRRTFLRQVAVGASGAAAFGWRDALSLQAEQLRQRGMACIVLFMRGAPSQFETFDPKPGAPTGGPTQAIPTAVNGIRIAEGWEPVAAQMNDIALIRSLTNNKEGNHDRAVYQLHTGYVQSGTVVHPTLGSIAAAELGSENFDLPHFVNIGHRSGSIGSGFLGMSVSPFQLVDPNEVPRNIELPPEIGAERFRRRHQLLQGLEDDFAAAGGQHRVAEHRALYRKAEQMVLSPRLKAFDLNQEPDSMRDRYGRTEFGQGCLLARRLVEQGVTFVEVESPGWDTHLDNFNKVKALAADVGNGFATLIADLKDRGMLDKTLVVWMGEFGRTPRINANSGRDHHPLSFNAALAGGGIRGGQVIGSTNAEGSDVAERPVSVPDLFCTFCQALQIDPRKENISPLGRPLTLTDGGQAVSELF
ncbi:DUF1501 domain-containing protein [Lignipirellula cremea]|uniref:DUF1501 domain-containing protein n=1 Tax=Lignipirellula cremea TaxID=2528010 RepID=A0A518E4N1_9BACT|nr:DUF1501 domain-containing protein [Lignipirellula cremea]QDU99051.1 hypothetical protein Pla8534_69620 [Lignipirellula cremea]